MKDARALDGGRNAESEAAFAIPDVMLTALKRIPTPGGDVLHAMKATDSGYAGFGEAYFSMIEPGAVKAWKRHQRMTLNLVVPVGAVRFVVHDDRPDSISVGRFAEVTLSPNSYSRLTIPPLLWMGFQCVGRSTAMLLNVANLPHDPREVDRQAADAVPFDWSVKP